VTAAPTSVVRRDAQIFTLGDSGYFLGIVALVNSLRLTGNAQPITVLDLGLTQSQRAILGPRCSFIEAAELSGMRIWMLQAFPHLVDPQGVIGIIDSDVIVTSRLNQFLDEAATGKIVAFPEPVCPDRHFSEWATLFDLTRDLRSGQRYVNAGCIFVSTLQHPEFLKRWWDCSLKINSQRTFLDDADYTSPVAFGEQDALNALLMSEMSPSEIAVQPRHLQRYFDTQPGRVQVHSVKRLDCSHDGHRVSFLHRVWVNKPWQRGSWRTIKRTAYSRCLRRVLVAKDVEIRVPNSELPLWLKRGPAGYMTLQLLFALEAFRAGRRRFKNMRRGPSTGATDPA